MPYVFRGFGQDRAVAPTVEPPCATPQERHQDRQEGMSLGLLYEHWMTRQWSWIRLVGFLVLAGLSAWLVPVLGGHVTTTTINP